MKLQNQLAERGARLYVRQVMERAKIQEALAEAKRQEKADAFWSEVGLSRENVVGFPVTLPVRGER